MLQLTLLLIMQHRHACMQATGRQPLMTHSHGADHVWCMHSMTRLQVEQLMLKVGCALEYADPFMQRMPSTAPGSPPLAEGERRPIWSASAYWDERMSSKEYSQAMVACARCLLAECCMRSWPALASKVGMTFVLFEHVTVLVCITARCGFGIRFSPIRPSLSIVGMC